MVKTSILALVLAGCGVFPPPEMARTKEGVVDCRCAFETCLYVRPGERVYFNTPSKGQCQIKQEPTK